MTKIGLIQFLLFSLISAGYGQKVKYKDIYALLSTKQFEHAEPFLRQYLRETADNPNAYLFMGNILQEKASKNDVLKETAHAVANMDSAIFYYDKALKTIDDREVRKNKEYYQNYNRRDLRTGEFGIKLSDIQFDLEKRMEALKDRIGKVKKAKQYFSLADTSYQRSNALFLSLQSRYASQHQLFLRADEQTIKDLKSLSARFDSCVRAFEDYKTANAALGKTGYNQKITVAEVSDFKVDGRSSSDFYQDDIRLWDYKKFADESRDVIEKEIVPMRAHLVTYDMEINKLREKLNKDSVSVRNDLIKVVDKLLYDQLKKFDPQPLPMIVFAMKTTDLEYRSTLVEHRSHRDSADLHFQISMLQKEVKLLEKLDSTAGILPEEMVAAKAADYADFVNNTYSSASVLKSYLRSLREFGMREHQKKTAQVDQYKKALQYIVDGTDSIPLSTEVATAFKPLITVPEKYTTGLSLQDTAQLKGYFYTVTASRKPDVKVYFPVDKSGFKASDLSATRALAYADSLTQTYYVLLYAERAAGEKFPATVARIDRSKGLAWQVDPALAFTPSDIVVSAAGELVISNGSQQVVVDRNGKVR